MDSWEKRSRPIGNPELLVKRPEGEQWMLR